MFLKFNSILMLICAFSNAEYLSYKNYKVYKALPKTENDTHILTELQEKHGEFMFWTDIIRTNSDVRIMVAPEKQTELHNYMSSAGIDVKIVIDNVEELINNQLKRSPGNLRNNQYTWDSYKNLEEIYNWLEQTVNNYPNIVSLNTLGQTFENRDLKVVIIDYKKNNNAAHGIIEGGIHAREWISPATATWIINEFLTSSDPNVRALAENIVWHVIPIANPDGYAYTFSTNRMWRKNRNPQNRVLSCAQWNVTDDSSTGIDLNRNFGFVWMSTGASSNPCAETYAGPREFSEDESKLIADYVLSLKAEQNVVYYLAFHSFSQVLLVPHSHVSGAEVLDVPNYGDLFEIGIKGMDKLKRKYGTKYTVGTSADILYEVSGSSFDWAKGVAKIPIVYLFELRDTGEYGFLLPPEQIVPNCEEVMDALLEMDRITRHMGYYHYNAATMNSLNLFLTTVILMMFYIDL